MTAHYNNKFAPAARGREGAAGPASGATAIAQWIDLPAF